MNFLSDVKYGMIELFKGVFTFQNYLTNPVYISVVYLSIMVLIALGMPAIVAPIYALIVTINAATVITKDVLEEYKKETIDVKYKTESGTITIPITVDADTTPIKREYAFELLFENHDSKLVKGFDAKDAFDNARLSESEKLDFKGAVQI